MILKIIIEIIIILIKIKIKNKKNKIKKIKKYNNKKGKYLTFLGNCISCHTLEGGKPFAGGYSLKTKFGIINSPNITKNKKYGIGKIKLKEFINTIKLGISFKDKNFLFPILPYLNFYKIKKNDIKQIFLFFKKINNEKIINKKNKLKFPLKYKNIITNWRILFFKKKYKLNKKKKSNLKRGEYITKTLGHCEMCHTKNNDIGKINKYFEYKGKNIIEKWKIKKLNIKKIKIENISKILKYGISKNKNINSLMIEVINNSLQYISKIEILSISKYLKNKINKNIILKKKKNKINLYKKKFFYKKNCKKCHGKIKLGKFPVYPKIINKKYIKNIIKNTKSINTIKNKYPSIMPNFLNFIKK